MPERSSPTKRQRWRTCDTTAGMRDLRRIVGVAVVASLLGGTGCSKIQEKITEKVAEKAAEKAVEAQTGGKVDIDSNSGSMKIKDEKTGAVVEWGTQAKLPDNWPSDVPVYPGAAIRASMSTNDGSSLSLETTDSIDKVSSFYKGKLSGFKKEAEMDMGATKIVSYSEGKRKVSLTFSESDKSDDKKTTAIQMIVATQK